MIDKTAIISKTAKIGKNVKIGPYSIIGDEVVIKDNVEIKSHVVIDGRTFIDEGTSIFPFSTIGLIPQDLKFSGEKSELFIGKNNIIREHVTIHLGTENGGGKTIIGNNCLLMVGVHVAHDCIVGNNVIMANNATLAGHVEVGDYAVIGGLSAVHQFVKIGHHAMIGGMSGIESNVIPFGQASGERANLVGLNLIGLKRRNFSRDEIHIIRNVYKNLFTNQGTLNERVEEVLKTYENQDVVKEIIDFIKENTSRALCQPKSLKNE